MRFVLLLCLAACGARVVTEETADLTGGTSSAGASAPEGGTGPTTSAGGGGAEGGGGGEPQYSPVPGCETLVWTGEPIVIQGTSRPQLPQLAWVAESSAGLVYADHPEATDLLLSVDLPDAFGVWPPMMSLPTLHQEGRFQNSLGTFSSRRDGTFAVTVEGIPLLARLDRKSVV